MGRNRSRSYTPTRRRRSPPRRKNYDDPRRSSYSRSGCRRRRSPAPSGLLVRNIALTTRPEDLRTLFEKFGPVKDIYLPRNYYTGEPRGFGFVKFRYPEDAAEAKERLNHTILGGREIRIVYAEENRKTPQEMRKITRPSSRYGGRTPPRSPRRRYRSYSRSPSLERHYSRSISRSRSPHIKRDNRAIERSQTPRGISPHDNTEYKSRRSYTPKASSPDGREYKARERSLSPRDISPHDVDYKARRSPTPRVVSPSDGRGYRARVRSPSQRDISPHDVDYKARKSRTPRATSPSDGRVYRAREGSQCQRDISPHDAEDIPSRDDHYRLIRRSRSPREISARVRKDDLESSRRSVSPRNESRDSLEHPKQESGESPLRTRMLSSSRLMSPGKKGRSISRSRSRSRSYSH